MLEKGKISAFQMGIMMYPAIIGTAILSLPSTMAQYAKNDLWLSPIWASLIGFLTVYIVYQLHQLYPKRTIIQYSEHIVGLIPGKVLGFIFVFYILHITGLNIRNYAEFLVGSFLPQTPISVVISAMLLLCAFAVRSSVEIVGRITQLFVPIVLFSLIIIIVLLLSDLDPKNLFPIMAHGIMPSIMGAIIPQGWFGAIFLISFFLPFLTDIEKGRKWSMISVFAVMFTMIVTNLFVLFLFGENTASYAYPIFNAARYISIADFFENLESMVMAIWVLELFVTISVFYYTLVLSTAQWLNLSDYRPIVFPLGLFIMIFSLWDLPSVMELNHINFFTYFYSLSIQTLIPLLLLLIAVLQKRNRQKSQETS